MSQNQSPSAANTRRYVVIHQADGVGAYDFDWSTSLSVRLDGLRFRYFHRGFRWVGNEGGVYEDERYLTPAEAREMWDQEFSYEHEKSFDELVAAALR